MYSCWHCILLIFFKSGPPRAASQVVLSLGTCIVQTSLRWFCMYCS
ncbi:hypothetical protein GLYMA_01G018651v4 [Glycine max]|nr:hypothetical protein GLYMA_01G018651v4 [Glycine max]KAH1161186.1 hypothetical protein GYH30_000188 [Glycine max]